MEQIMWLNAFLMTNYQDRMALPMNSLINVGHTLNKNSTTFVVAFSKKKTFDSGVSILPTSL